MNVVLLGAPGAGKGTQADRLAEEFNLPHVASGDLFRSNVGQRTELGLRAKSYMDQGLLVPDDITIGMVKHRLEQPDCAAGAVLDGFPRTLPQAKALDRCLEDLGRALDLVLYIEVPEQELLGRLSLRWICGQCQATFHMKSNPPEREGMCDECSGELYQRTDDGPETVRNRLRVYLEQTAPLIEHYREVGLLVEVDGTGGIFEITQRLLEAIRGKQGDKPPASCSL